MPESAPDQDLTITVTVPSPAEPASVNATPEKNPSEQTPEENENKSRKHWKRWAKKIRRFMMWFTSVIVTLLLLVMIFRDAIIKSCLTDVGSFIAGVEISVDELNTTLDGEVKISNLKIANPIGFKEENCITLSSFYLNVDLLSLFSDKIIIEDVEVNELHAVAEFKSDGSCNMLNILESIRRNIRKKARKEPTDKTEEKTVFEIHNFALRNSSLKICNENDAVTIGLKSFTGSTSEGQAELKELTISPPRDFRRTNMLDLKRLLVVFDGESLFSNRLIIHEIILDNAHGFCEFRKDSSFSPKVATHIITLPEDNSTPDTKQQDTLPEPDNGSKNSFFIKKLIIRNCSMKIFDQRTGCEISYPVEGSYSDIHSSDSSLVESLREGAEGLGKNLGEVTNVSEKFQDAVDKTGNFLKDKVINLFKF